MVMLKRPARTLHPLPGTCSQPKNARIRAVRAHEGAVIGEVASRKGVPSCFDARPGRTARSVKTLSIQGALDWAC